MLSALLFLLGLCAGSFLNVCIRRLPKGESIVLPRSHCPDCGHPLAWFENIPLLSFACLRGRCRRCRKPISWRYPFVEFLTGLLFVIYGAAFGLTAKTAALLIFACILVALTMIDWAEGILPDELTLGGLVVGLAASAAVPQLQGAGRPLSGLLLSLVGAAVGFGVLALIRALGTLAFRREAMGAGDLKLLAMIGAFLGWQAALLTVFLSSLLGSVVGVSLKWRFKVQEIPYGPFLAMGAVISSLWSRQMIGCILGKGTLY